MIFVTVGTQGPFDRLVHAVDDWALAAGRDDVFAQVGATRQPPRHIAWEQSLGPSEFRHRFEAAQLVIAHAGMGTIINAMHRGVPILVMPRLASLGEQRNEHQLATARHLRESGRVAVALDEADLRRQLDALPEIAAPARVAGQASQELIRALRAFIEAEPG